MRKSGLGCAALLGGVAHEARQACVWGGGRYPTPSSAAHTPRTPRLAQTGATFANTLHLLQTYSQLIPQVLPAQGTSAGVLNIYILW